MTVDQVLAALRAVDRRKALFTGLGAVAGLLLAGLVALAATAAYLYPRLPPLDKVTDYQPRQPLQIVTSDGVEIAQFGTERRHYLPIAEIPRQMQEALLAVEDTRFREHGGIDPKGIARAAFAMLTGGMRQGASTITQQVARTFFLSSRLSPERKIKEALLALQIEHQLTKDQILELYMNQIYLGQRAYGFAAAAQVYFDKPLDALSVAETAMLAGLPQNPAYANPITDFGRAKARQLIVLGRMHETGLIDDAQWAAAKAEKLHIHSPLAGGLHAEYVAEMARKLVVAQYGPEVYAQGIRVVTSLRAADQNAAWAALHRGLLEHERKQPYTGPEDHEELPPPGAGAAEVERAAALALKDHRDDETLRVAIVLSASPREVVAQLASGEQVRLSGEGLRWAQPALSPKASDDLALRRGGVIRVVRQERPATKKAPAEVQWRIAQWPEAQAALVSLDPQSGRIRAWVGGFDFNKQPFDHVVRAWRQPGSSFKPFLYSAALEHGVTPATVVNDAPLALPGADGPESWQPQNSDGRFDGPLTVREALAKSKNSVSIRLLQQIGVATVRDWAERFGFDADKQPDNLTLALGAGSTTPLQMAQAYAVLANGGWHIDPVLIESVSDAKGHVLFQAAPGEAEPVVPARNVFITDSLLNDVTRVGTAAKAQAQLGRPDLYGKTGTTNDAVDAWFAGFQPGLVAVAWMGYDDPRSLGVGESGGGLALPIWIDYMRQALAGVPVKLPGDPPDGVVRVGGDWAYSEWADGGSVQRIGFDEPQPASR
jgi:penicillin-binding protein 1A